MPVDLILVMLGMAASLGMMGFVVAGLVYYNAGDLKKFRIALGYVIGCFLVVTALVIFH